MKRCHYPPLTMLLLISLNRQLFSQCAPTPPAITLCTGGSGAAFNGANINGGQFYYFSGGPTLWPSGVNLNGGTLTVCGNLTMGGIGFNSGALIIETGGVLTINGGGDLYLNGNSSICNRGTFILNKNLHLQNANNTIWNETGSSMTVNGIIELNSSTSKLINNGGIIDASHILLQGSASAGAVCTNANSCFNLSAGLTNNFTNGWTFTGSGQAAINFNGNALLNNNLTSNPEIIICQGVGSTTTGAMGWGNASVFQGPCSSCAIALPINEPQLEVNLCEDSLCIKWKAGSGENTTCLIEASPDAMNYTPIISFQENDGDNMQYHKFKLYYLSHFPDKETIYFRLKEIAKTTNYYSRTSAIIRQKKNETFLYPNPFDDILSIQTNYKDCSLFIYNTQMNIAFSQDLAEGKNKITTANLEKGIYLVVIRDKHNTVIHAEKMLHQ